MRPQFSLSREPHVELEEIRGRLEDIPAEQAEEVFLDLGQVAMLDSLLLGQLVRMCLTLQKRGQRLQLTNLSFHARMVVHHANLDAVFGLAVTEPPRWDSNISTF